MLIECSLDWKQSLAELGPVFAERAAEYDETDDFVAANFVDVPEARLFSALVPEELGGGAGLAVLLIGPRARSIHAGLRAGIRRQSC